MICTEDHEEEEDVYSGRERDQIVDELCSLVKEVHKWNVDPDTVFNFILWKNIRFGRKQDEQAFKEWYNICGMEKEV